MNKRSLLVLSLLAIASCFTQVNADSFESAPYLGFGLGYQFNNGTQKNVSGVDTLNSKFNGGDFKGSIFAGYLHRFEDTPVAIIIEPFAEYANNKDKFSGDYVLGTPPATDSQRKNLSVKTKFDWSIGSKLKLGYVLEDYDIMFYALAGLKFSRVSFDATIDTVSYIPSGMNNSANWSKHSYLFGYMFGAGVEKAIGKHRVSLEVVNTIYQKKTFSKVIVDDISDFEKQSVTIKPKNWSIMARYSIPL